MTGAHLLWSIFLRTVQSTEGLGALVLFKLVLLLQEGHGWCGPGQATSQQQTPKWCIWTLHSNPDLRLCAGRWCHVLRTEGFVLTGLTSHKAICTQDGLECHVASQRRWCVLQIFMQNIMKITRSVSWDDWALELESYPWNIKPFLLQDPLEGCLQILFRAIYSTQALFFCFFFFC